VTILLETDVHSYYEIAINAAGAVLDVNREPDNFGWDSQPDVATRIGDDYWTIEMPRQIRQARSPSFGGAKTLIRVIC